MLHLVSVTDKIKVGI